MRGGDAWITRLAQKSQDWISPVMVGDGGDKERKPCAITDNGMTSNIKQSGSVALVSGSFLNQVPPRSVSLLVFYHYVPNFYWRPLQERAAWGPPLHFLWNWFKNIAHSVTQDFLPRTYTRKKLSSFREKENFLFFPLMRVSYITHWLFIFFLTFFLALDAKNYMVHFYV